MPSTCVIIGCRSRSNKDIVSFYSIPSVLNHRFLTDKNELSKKRRAQWLAAIKRDMTEATLKFGRVCSKHFITGKPAPLEDVNHPDWVPSQNMGYGSPSVSPSPMKVIDRSKKRRKLPMLEDSESNIDFSEYDSIVEQPIAASVQTDITMFDLNLKLEQLEFAKKKKVEMSPLGLMDDTTNDEKWIYYTGFVYKIVNFVIYAEVEKYISSTNTTVLSSFNQLLLTLVKLRLDLHFRDLAYRFKISRTNASTYFENIIDILYKRFKSLIIWPDRSVSQKNIPTCFKEAFHDKTTVIIDCFEVLIEKPATLLTQQQCWSYNTIKFLIGITPQGTISYISKAWCGRTPDKQIVEESGFCDNIRPGDIVLADRGFLIKETLGIHQAELVIPAFTKHKNQLHPVEIEDTRQLAHVRIHIEKIIGVIKNKFNICKGIVPINMLKKGNDPEKVMLDKIITVCCAFINISPPAIPL